MSDPNYEKWLDDTLPLHQRLTESVVTIIENLLKSEEVDYLAVSGRTKKKTSALEKIKRKGYRNPEKSMTDLSGVRIILYFESDVEKASKIIEEAFHVDKENSLNQDDLMSADQIGYRSVHFVCELGDVRAKLPEFSGLAKLKFEFQVRTVLQHAWAELAHDRNYKFSGSLPKKLERQLYLYAGMLEIADRGFDEVSKQIDQYMESVDERSGAGDLDFEINSISLQRFIKLWCEKENVELRIVPTSSLDELIYEIRQFGINTLEQLSKIIPAGYGSLLNKLEYETSIFGMVRDWMLIHDWNRFHRDVKFNWTVEQGEADLIEHFIKGEDLNNFYDLFGFNDTEGDEEPYL